jgi:enamine deaminase RidA (YjgF/YER057c/UK114 family)
MPKNYLNPPSVFPSVEFGFSQGVVASGTRTLYVSGQTAWDADRQLVGNALREAFSGPARPAATWIGIAALADPGFLIEIEATAVLE